MIGGATNFESAWNGGERNWLKLLGTTSLGAFTGGGMVAAGATGPVGGVLISAALGYMNGGLNGLIMKGKFDNRAAQQEGFNGALAGSAGAIMLGGESVITATGSVQIGFVMSIVGGLVLTYGDRYQQRQNEEQARCYTAGICTAHVPQN